jgi:hypothetical protein
MKIHDAIIAGTAEVHELSLAEQTPSVLAAMETQLQRLLSLVNDTKEAMGVS